MVLVGGTSLGRSHSTASFYPLPHCGLTADCTKLEMKSNTDLVQIRRAFGGNIMAPDRHQRIRPQFCYGPAIKSWTGRKKVEKPSGKVTICNVSEDMVRSRIRGTFREEILEHVRSIEGRKMYWWFADAAQEKQLDQLQGGRKSFWVATVLYPSHG